MRHQLGINLADIDIAFLSHAHYDHAGGFETFFKENEKAPVYLQDTSAENCYYRPDNTDRYIGIPTHLLETYKKRFQYIDHVCEVEKGVWLIPHLQRIWTKWEDAPVCIEKLVMNMSQMISHMNKALFSKLQKD